MQFGAAEAECSKLAPVRDFEEHEFALIKQMLSKGVNAPLTSSAGRLFDGVASLIGLRHHATFEDKPPWSWSLPSIRLSRTPIPSDAR